MMQVTRAAFQALANLNEQATDPQSHTLVKSLLQEIQRSCYLLNSDGRPPTFHFGGIGLNGQSKGLVTAVAQHSPP